MGKQVCVVTGGRGLVARHVVLKLLESGTWVVRILDVAPKIVVSPDEKVLAKALAAGDAQYVCADVRAKDAVFPALQKASVVFHMAAPDSNLSDYALHYAVSVTGTQNVIHACLHHGVRKLIYTSSPSVVFDAGGDGVRDADESTPYPAHFNDAYAETKAKGEQLVLAADGKNGLLTCAIRASVIFGPGDKLFLPTIVAAARAGKTKFIVGDGENLFDFTYVDNVVHAHICGEKALGAPGSPSQGDLAPSGKAYFITNGEPVKMWEFIGRMLEGLGYDRPKCKLPVNVLLPLAHAVVWGAKKLGRSPGQFTPARIRAVSSSGTFDISRAHKLLGYVPVVSLDEGVKRTLEASSHLRKEGEVENKAKRAAAPPSSKVHRVLGNGAWADVLLWRDSKQTAAYLVLVAVSYHYLFVCGYKVMELVARLLLVAVVGSFCYAAIPARLLGTRLPAFPDSPVQLPEGPLESGALCIRFWWNSLAGVIRRVVQERSWALLLGVVLVLRVLTFLGRFSVKSLLAFAVLEAFTLPYAYEQYEEEVDEVFTFGVELLTSYKDVVVSKLPGSLRGGGSLKQASRASRAPTVLPLRKRLD